MSYYKEGIEVVTNVKDGKEFIEIIEAKQIANDLKLALENSYQDEITIMIMGGFALLVGLLFLFIGYELGKWRTYKKTQDFLNKLSIKTGDKSEDKTVIKKKRKRVNKRKQK